MVVNKSSGNQKTPPSEMIRVPTALIGAVRQLSKLHRQGHTIALLEALEELISKFDSSIEIDFATLPQANQRIEKRLSKLESQIDTRGSGVETKLEAIANKLERLERAIALNRYSNKKQRRQSFPYQQPPIELQPKANENLAQRLGVTPQSLIAERENNSAKEFLSWSRNRDPMSVGWEWNASDQLYHPVK
jgi:hypothetical protein